MSTPPRHQEPNRLALGGWCYEDPEQMRFARACLRHGFGLPAFDDFIDSLPAGIAKDELLDWRQQAFRTFMEDNNHALKGWLQAAWVNWKSRLTNDHIRPTLAMGLKYSAEQSERGRKGAAAKWGDKLNMSELIMGIALSPAHNDETAKELWPYLFAKLDEMGCNPTEQEDPADWKKSCYLYDGKDSRESITGGRFANVVSESRKKGKSR